MYLTPEQEKDKSHFTDKEVTSKNLNNNIVTQCFGPGHLQCNVTINLFEHQTGQEHELIESMPLLEWFANNYKKFGATLEIVTDKSQEGSQFVKGFGGIGGKLN